MVFYYSNKKVTKTNKEFGTRECNIAVADPTMLFFFFKEDFGLKKIGS